MAPKKTSELMMQAAAYLYSQKYSQEDIKNILRVSQSTVSRSIQHALGERWLEINVRFVTENIPPDRMQAIEAFASPQHLKEQLHEFARKHNVPTMPNIRVFPSAKRDTLTTQEARLEWFGQAAAGHIRDLLLRSKVCGMAWGYTIASVVRGLRRLDPPPLRKGNPIEFIPLCGEPLGTTATQLSSSSLAAQFDEVMNGETSHSLSLAAVPALIPEGFTAKEVQVIHKLIGQVAAYHDIFQSIDGKEVQHKPWIDRLDTILTGIGPVEHPLGYWGDALVRTGGIDRDRLSRLAVGDISGILFARPALSTSKQKELEKIKERWTGISEQQMRRCAAQASQNGTAGVIVVAIGENKAASVCESVKRGLVNELVIDRDLADALVQETSG